MMNLPTRLMNLYLRAMRPPVSRPGVYSESAKGGRRGDPFVPSSQTLHLGTYHMFAGVPSDSEVRVDRLCWLRLKSAAFTSKNGRKR
ncbi:unnamed protein product [Pleuronectes platessa]|uniref:Uncharacterized protein n=1 Tax=Pleuronectes platessa TaxID=8262 RepID=A0A9N7TR17_PLEPL|nr:unnamed protein product [Pleuronectes platessa]